MYDKTTSAQFRKYGFIYDEAKDINKDDLILKQIVTSDKVISSLYKFSEPAYIEIVKGMASILISDSNSVILNYLQFIENYRLNLICILILFQWRIKLLLI